MPYPEWPPRPIYELLSNHPQNNIKKTGMSALSRVLSIASGRYMSIPSLMMRYLTHVSIWTLHAIDASQFPRFIGISERSIELMPGRATLFSVNGLAKREVKKKSTFEEDAIYSRRLRDNIASKGLKLNVCSHRNYLFFRRKTAAVTGI